MKSTAFSIVLLLSFSFFQASSGLRCVQCQRVGKANFPPGFDCENANHLPDPTPCGDDDQDICFFAHSKKDGDKTEYWSRGCGSSSSYNELNVCKTAKDYFGAVATTFACDKDGCNDKKFILTNDDTCLVS